MLEKWKQRAVQMNFRRAVILFIVTSFVLIAASSAAVYGNFRSRVSDWEKFAGAGREYEEEEKGEKEEKREKEEKGFDDGKSAGFSDGEYDGDFKEEKERDWEDISKRLYLSAGDIALMAGCGIIGMVTGIWYWALVLIAVYRKAYRMGVNAALWTLAALVFNLAVLVILYLYAVWKGTCTNCGRVKADSGKFCDRCGNILKRECPQCRQAVDISSAYCGGCGKKLDEKEG